MEFKRRLVTLVLDEVLRLTLIVGVTTWATARAIHDPPRYWLLVAVGAVGTIRQTYRLWTVRRAPPNNETITARSVARQTIIGIAMGLAWGMFFIYFFSK